MDNDIGSTQFQGFFFEVLITIYVVKEQHKSGGRTFVVWIEFLVVA